jgi:hypothetical protein
MGLQTMHFVVFVVFFFVFVVLLHGLMQKNSIKGFDRDV